ncbi:MAG: cellulase family glycosylhydrolase [Pseudomonadota bacterium]
MISRLFRLFGFAIIFAICFPGAGHVADFKVSRAISMDQWVEWPGPDRWNEPAVVENFPEWLRFVNDDELRYLRQAGLDTVRLPIDPGFLLQSGDIVRTNTALEGVKRAIDRLRAADLKVIVDMHTIPRGDSNAIGIEKVQSDPQVFDAYLNLVGQIAARLRDYSPNDVAFELINEPTIDCIDKTAQTTYENMLRRLHAAARAKNPDITLVFTGACLGKAEGLQVINPAIVNDENTIWTFHHYEPFKLTHQSATWAGPWVEHIANIPYPPSRLSNAEAAALIEENKTRIFASLIGEQAMKIADGTRYDIDRLRSDAELVREMTEPFEKVAAWADQHGIARDRIFLGEFGMIRQEWERPAATRAEWRIGFIRDIISLSERHGFGWSMWSFGGAFGMVQEFSGNSLDNPLVDEVLR